jgi:hypothetical protein
LPLSVKCLTQTGKKLPFAPLKLKKPPGLTPVAFKGGLAFTAKLALSLKLT